MASGNTKPKRASALIKWCGTINNHTDEDVLGLERMFDIECKAYIAQEEVGAEGTKHLQFAFMLETRKRIAALKEYLPRAHLESMRGTWAQNCAYCSKPSFDGAKTWALGAVRGVQVLRTEQLYEWQTELVEELRVPADDRHIVWYTDVAGGHGKTQLCKYIIKHFNAIMVNGLGDNMLYGVTAYIQSDESKRDDLIVLVNIARGKGNRVSYSALEQLKDGLWFNQKYESSCVMINSPHVVVFANEDPIVEALTTDRWIIRKLD